MPITYRKPAYDYGLALLNKQQGGAAHPSIVGALSTAAPYLVEALMSNKAEKKQEASSQATADALLQLQAGGDPFKVAAEIANPHAREQFLPFAIGERDRIAEMGERRRQYDVSTVDAANADVQQAIDRSLARGDRANEMLSRQAFEREEGALDRSAQSEAAAAQREYLANQAAMNRQNAVDVAATRSGSAGSNVQSVQPLGDGTLLKVYRDGSTEQVTLDGRPITGARNDPEALFRQSAAGAGGRAAGQQAESAPVLDANFKVINDALGAFEDPNVKAQAPRAIGFGSFLPNFPGWNTEFRSRRDQLKGQAFLQAYSTLRGGGQITEIEGEKATQAIARLNDAQTPDEFYKALSEAKTTFRDIYGAAKERASRGAVVPQLQQQQQGAPRKTLNWNELP